MRFLRGRFRTSDVLIVAIALIAATASTLLLKSADDRMSRGAAAERLLEEIEEGENQLYKLSVALLSGKAQPHEVRREDSHVVSKVAEIEALEPEVRELLAEVTPADRRFRQTVYAELSLLAAQASDPAGYHRSNVFPAHQAAIGAVADAYAQLEDHNQSSRHRISVISIFAALLAVLGTAIGALLLNRGRRARVEAQAMQLAGENRRLRDQTAVAQLLMHSYQTAPGNQTSPAKMSPWLES